MIPAAFDYHRPGTLAEAVELLARYGDAAKVLSGGKSLLPVLKLRLGAVGHLVDIGRVPGLEYIKEDGGFLKIGGATTRVGARALGARSPRSYPILRDTAALIADPLVRNLATVGGNLAHGDPANDHAGDDARARRHARRATGPRASGRSPPASSSRGSSSTALATDEILTEIRVPSPPPRSGGAYLKLKRKVGDFAMAAAAVQVTLDAKGAIERAGIGAHQRRRDAGRGVRRGQVPRGQSVGQAATTRWSPKRRASPRRRARRAPTAAARSSTSRRWRACWSGARSARPSSAREGADHGQAPHQRHGQRDRARSRGRVAPAARPLPARERCG